MLHLDCLKLLVIHRPVGGAEIDRAFRDLLDSSARPDRLIVNLYLWIFLLVLTEPFGIHGIREARASPIDRKRGMHQIMCHHCESDCNHAPAWDSLHVFPSVWGLGRLVASSLPPPCYRIVTIDSASVESIHRKPSCNLLTLGALWTSESGCKKTKGSSAKQRPLSRTIATTKLSNDPKSLSRQPVDFLSRDAKVIRNQRRWIARQPFGDGDLFKHRAIEQREKFRRLAAHLLDKMTEALLDKANLPRPELFGARPAMRPEHRHPRVPADVVLPFIRIRMPVHFAQRPGLQVLQHRRQRGVDREFLHGDNAFPAAGESERTHFAEPEFVRVLARLQIIRQVLLRHALGDFPRQNIELFLRQPADCARGPSKIAGNHRLGPPRDPIRDAEPSALPEVPVVAPQDKMRLFVAAILQRVSVPLRKIPDVPRLKNVRRRLPIGSDHRCEYFARKNQGPFRRDGVPMQFADAPDLQPHRTPGQTFSHR